MLLSFSFSALSGVEEYKASETKTFVLTDISEFYTYATANDGSTWIDLGTYTAECKSGKEFGFASKLD